MRAVIAVACLLTLGSCNDVWTDKPLFSHADQAGAPAFKSGIWRALSDKPCAVNERKPVASWPTCAGGFAIIDGTFADFEGKAAKRALTPMGSMVLANGAPLILQFHSASASATPSEYNYSYAGLRVTSQDGQGRIVAFTFWDVECGPSPPAGAKTADGKPAGSGTVEPLPGLTMDKDNTDCTTTSVDALRSAAAASEKWATPMSFRWVRDGDS